MSKVRNWSSKYGVTKQKVHNLNLEITAVFHSCIFTLELLVIFTLKLIKNYVSTRLMNLNLQILILKFVFIKHQFISIKKYLLKPDMMAHTFNPGTERTEAGGTL